MFKLILKKIIFIDIFLIYKYLFKYIIFYYNISFILNIQNNHSISILFSTLSCTS